MRKIGIPTCLIRWTKSFLSNRRIRFLLDGLMGNNCDLNIRVPQGSPVSPILSVIYSSQALKELSENPIISDLGIPVVPLSYIDDFAFLVILETPKSAHEAVKDVLATAADLLEKGGQSLDLAKTDLIHFTGRCQSQEDSLTLKLYGKSHVVTPSKVVRWLGVFFDKNLRFNQHVGIMINRAKVTLMGIRLLSNTVRGLPPKHTRILVKTCIIPVLMYASVAWYNKDDRQTALLKPMQTLLNQAERMVSGAFRTTPLKATRMLSHLPSIRNTLEWLHNRAAHRLLKLPEMALVSQRLPRSWRKNHGTTPYPPLQHIPVNSITGPKLSPILRLAKRLGRHKAGSYERTYPYHTENAPWVEPITNVDEYNVIFDPNTVGEAESEERKAYADRIEQAIRDREHNPYNLIFCDGSAKARPEYTNDLTVRAGGAIVTYVGSDLAVEELWNRWGQFDPLNHPFTFCSRVGLGEHCTAFDGEMLALVLASRYALRHCSEPGGTKHFIIFSDSTSALQKIVDPGPHPAQALALMFIQNIKTICREYPEGSVTIQWSPGHLGISGNEQADHYARKAAEDPDPMAVHKVQYKSLARLKFTASKLKSARHREEIITMKPSPG